MRIVGLANPDLVDPSSAPWPAQMDRGAKYVDTDSAEANGYSPKTRVSYLQPRQRTMKKGDRDKRPPSIRSRDRVSR
jgi:chitodextrinase